VTDRVRLGNKRRKGVYAKGWGTEGRDNQIASWYRYTSSRIWRKIKYDRISNKELLVARSDKRYRKICRQLWYVSENEEFDRGTSKKFEVE